MAILALLQAAIGRVRVLVHPPCPQRMQGMGTAIHRGGHLVVTGGAFRQHPLVSLQSQTLDVVIVGGTGKFGMRGIMARFALQAAMAAGKTIEGQARGGRVGVGGEGEVHGHAGPAIGVEYGGVADLPVVF